MGSKVSSNFPAFMFLVTLVTGVAEITHSIMKTLERKTQ
nr:MAG TPA: hypothetical protein [Caudoviricetes sp.]